MSITIHNYEAFLLDYMEGNLDIAKEQELHEFLSLHPELNPGEEVHTVTIVPENITFTNKNSLKKFNFDQKITDFNFEDFCIAYHEGLLTSDQEIRLNQYGLRKNKEKDFELFGRTYLKPDPSFSFPDKNALYRKKHIREIRFIILQVSAVAATVALLMTILNPFQKEQNILPVTETKEIATIYFHPKPDAVKTMIIKKQVKKKPEVQEKRIFNPVTEKEREKEQVLSQLTSLPAQLATIPEGQLNLNDPDQVNSTDTKLKENGIVTFISEAFSEIKSKEIKLDKIKKPKISLVDLFKAGIDGINTVTDSNMKFTEQTDTLGNVTVVSFESTLIKYHRYRNN